MLINTDASYNRVPESYLQAASFDANKVRAFQIAPEAVETVEGERPAYIVSLSKDARELSNDEKGQQKSEEVSAEKVVQQAQEPWRKGKSKGQQEQAESEIEEFKRIESEVIRHENAHKSAGGQYAGGISYDRAAGPDGKQYIVGGEVSIDTSEEDTPEKTIAKMLVVKRAALAPADPSGQDRSVVAQASRIEARARGELAQRINESLSVSGKTGKEESELKVFKDVNAQGQEPNLGNIVDLST